MPLHNRVNWNVEFSMDRRHLNRRERPDPAVAAALGLVQTTAGSSSVAVAMRLR
jgi:hypothetical protein